jgi:hypothetical protein
LQNGFDTKTDENEGEEGEEIAGRQKGIHKNNDEVIL